MPDAIYRGLAAKGPFIGSFLAQQFGIASSVAGPDLVISDAAVAQMISPDTLTLHHQMKLTTQSRNETAHEMSLQVPADLKKYAPPRPTQITIHSGYGRISQFDEMATKVMVESDENLHGLIRDQLLPFMEREFDARFVTGVSINSTYQQAQISLSKIALLAERFDMNEAKRRRDAGALDGVIPHGVTALAFVDALTRFSPLILTIPVGRHGCAWHFQSSAMWSFPSVATNALVSQFTTEINPLSSSPHQFGLRGLQGMSEPQVWRYLRFVVIGVNRLFRFLNDPRCFLAADGTVDLLRKVQAYCAIHLVFADVNGINFSTSAHYRISYAMSCLDKLANLRVELGGHSAAGYKEEEAMREFASLSQRDELKRIVSKQMRAMLYDDLSNALNPVVDTCFKEIQDHLTNQANVPNTTERQLLNRIRWQRNLRHGTFLKSQQFESLFFEADGTIPDGFATLPFLLMLGIISDPAAFLGFRPVLPP